MIDINPNKPKNSTLEPPPAGYQDSYPVPPEAIEEVYWAALEPRIHRCANIEIEAAEAVNKQWIKYGGPSVDFSTKSIADIGGLTACCLPEGSIEKYRKIYELIAVLYLEDDYYDGIMSIESKLSLEEHKKIRAVLKQLRGKHYVDLVSNASQDKVLWNWVQKWDEWSEQSKAVDEQGFLLADSLEAHLDMRNTMHGCHQFNFLMVYACDIKLSDAQVERFRPAKELLFQIASLGNDIPSFDREWISHASDGKTGLPPASSISFILATQDVTVAEAKQIAKVKYLAIEQNFIELRQKLLEEEGYPAEIETYEAGNPVPDAVRYLSYLQYIASGNLIWSLRAKRYHMDPNHKFFPKPDYKIKDLIQLFESQEEVKQKSTKTDPVVNGTTARKPKSNKPSSKRNIDALSEENQSEGLIKRQKVHESRINDGTPIVTNKDKTEPSSSPWLLAYPPLSDITTLEPYDYVASLSGKKVRKALVDAIDVWYQVPQERLDIISSVINLLHSSSLITDDIEDGTTLRRGAPAAHMVFGLAQSINSANYLIVQAVNESRKLSASALTVIMDELRELHVGQGRDLNTIFCTKCPSPTEYIRIADGKTGGLFRMISGLMKTEASQNRDLDIQELLTLLGRYYQIWDDYKDLIDKDGTASDLDEGVYSFILVHALNNGTPSDISLLNSLLYMRSRQGVLSTEQKMTIMKVLARTKSLEYTLTVLEELQDAIEKKMVEIESNLPEKENGRKNWMFRAIMAKLRIVR